MPMDARKFRILQAIIDDYILTAIPVGSRTISKKYEVGLSSATIRNEMSDLEDLGYLDQPHVSAGRVPSAKAYRLYVDQLLRTGKLHGDDAASIREHFSERTGKMEDVINRAAQAGDEPQGRRVADPQPSAGTGNHLHSITGDCYRQRHRS